MMAGRVDDALAAFQKAVELRPDLSETHRNLGVAFNMAGRRDEAIAELRRGPGTSAHQFRRQPQPGEHLHHAMGRTD